MEDLFDISIEGEKRLFCEPETAFGNVFYELRQNAILMTTEEDIQEIRKMIDELSYNFYGYQNPHVSRYQRKMSFTEKSFFRITLSHISILCSNKQAQIIDPIELHERKITRKIAFQELSQEQKDWYNTLIGLQNAITLEKSNR